MYLFGSHDKENADTYCMLDYVFYSASIYDLSEWSTKGVSYSAKQDPQYGGKLKYMYAPDVVQAVMNDNGAIRLYYGTWYPFHEQAKFLAPIFHKVESNMFGKTVAEIKEYKEGVMGPIHVELEDDMRTIKSKPVQILPFHVKGTDFEEHPFFEASSIRKVGARYYFVYSSMKGQELCYATSDYPDRRVWSLLKYKPMEKCHIKEMEY